MIKDFNKAAIITAEKEISYKELKQHINDYATITPDEPEAKTIIFSENREEWVYAFFSIWQNKGIAVPVDASSTVSDLEYIIKDCKPTALWTSEACREVAEKAIKESGIDVTILRLQDPELQKIDTKSTEWTVKDDSCAVIIYTSGTTGNPKGVMLSYANLWANMAGVSEEVPILTDKRRVIMLLPVHHILPLMGTVIIPILKGGGIAICPSMSGPDIMETLCRGKIGVFIGVPRLWQMLYAGIKKKIDASAITRALFAICKKANNRTLSRFIFQSVHKKMGGHLDYCVSGGAALDREIGEGLRTLGIDVLEGYGMTETAPIIAFTRPDDIIPGCVGLPLPSVECKIIDPATGLTISTIETGKIGSELIGELCAKGPNVMMGYYNRPEETAAVLDKDGFIHTGDLARFDEKGRVIITGRSKEIIVLSNGKNVQPNEIEFKLEQYDDKVKEAAVTQDGDMLHAIIVPQELWGSKLSDSEAEQILKREVIEPYNRTVENYKKLMKLTVYRGDLPRTKLDKLQRFKLKKLLEQAAATNREAQTAAALSEEQMTKEFRILKDYIEEEKKLPVYPDSHIETDLAFDSLDKVGLQGFIEQTFGTIVNADTMAEYKDIQALADHIASCHTRMEVEKIDWHKILTTESSHLTLPVAGLSHRYMAKAFKAFFSSYNNLTVKGLENLPKDGPFILAPNHQSYLDGAIVMADVPWSVINKCYFYATEEHVNNPVLRYMASRHNVIIMERRNLKESILKLGEVLKQGKSIVIFPEGTRTWNGELSAFKKTFAILAKELNVPIVPVRLTGAYEALPRSTRFIKPHRITVEYLPAIVPTPSQSYDSLTQEVKDAIEHHG